MKLGCLNNVSSFFLGSYWSARFGTFLQALASHWLEDFADGKPTAITNFLIRRHAHSGNEVHITKSTPVKRHSKTHITK